MKYRDYEFRQLKNCPDKWEIVQWFPKQLIPSCVTVMIFTWKPSTHEIEVYPIMDRVLRTYQVKNFDKWLDVCMKSIELSMEEIEDDE